MASRSHKKTTVVTKTTSSARKSSSRANREGGGEDEDTSSVYLEEEFDAESVLSPTRSSRKHEKKQLAGLNDRLATYIDRVRSLEIENQRLTVQIRSSEETVSKERVGIRKAFEAELADARRLLDETAKEKARLQIEADKARAEFDNLRARIGKLEKELKESENRRLYAESQVQDLQAKLNNSDSQRKHWEDEAKALQKEVDRLSRQLSTAQSQLEEETLLRVDLENRIQSMREELQFNKTIYEQELEETRAKKQTEITEIGDDLEKDYQNKLHDHLTDMRAQFDGQLRRNRQEIEDMYEKKLASMQDQVERSRESAGSARDELIHLRTQVDTLEKERNHYHSLVDSLERKVKDLETKLASVRDDYFGQLRRKDEDIRALREEISRMLGEYQDLMDTKVQLDVEIEAYRRLLEGEEDRLNLSQENSASSRKRARVSIASTTHSAAASSDARTTKRARRLLQERETGVTDSFSTKGQANGDIEIVDHDISGSYVKLRNNGKRITRVGGDEEITYKFHSRSQIAAGGELTVWAKSAGKKHSPPEDYVMKEADWPSGERVRTQLLNTDDEEMAWRESTRSSTSSTFSFRSGLSPADLQNADPDGRCAVM